METISIRDLGLAAYLRLNDVQLIRFESGEDGQGHFVFQADEELEALRTKYLNAGVIPAKNFFNECRDLKSLIFSAKQNN